MSRESDVEHAPLFGFYLLYLNFHALSPFSSIEFSTLKAENLLLDGNDNIKLAGELFAVTA